MFECYSWRWSICSGPRQPDRTLVNNAMLNYVNVQVSAWIRSLNTVSQSVSQWNAWPATGRSALQELRSCAIVHASLELSQVSSSICCTHAGQGRPRWRFHSGLMSGLPPARASAARRSAVVAARDQKWRASSDKSGLLSLLCQFG